MNVVQISPLLRRKMERMFLPEQWDPITTLLKTECGSGLPLIDKQGIAGIERIRCAVLKLSSGSMEELVRAVKQANIDWRDVLVAAGFGENLAAHLDWLNPDSDAL